MQKYRNRIIAGFAIGFVIYVVLLLFVNTGDLLQQLKIYPWVLLIPVILLKFVSWFCRFMQWHYFLGVIDANDKIKRFDSVVLFIAGFTMAVSPGKIAEMLKAVVLKTKTGIPIAKSAPVIIAERVVDGVAVLLLAFIAILLAGSTIDLGEYRFMIWLSSALLIVGLIAVQIRPLAYFFLDLIARLPLVKRLHEPLVTFYESSNEMFKIKHVIIPTLFGMIAAVGDVIGFMIILTGFGIEISWALFLQTMVIVCLSSAIGALSGVPNGAGVTEISVGAMLMAIVAPTNPVVTLPVATTAALVEGFFHKWFRVFVGLGVGVIFRNRLLSPEVETTLAEMEAERAQKRAGLSVETGNL
jgi:glycosyltransferase 2 family protein